MFIYISIAKYKIIITNFVSKTSLHLLFLLNRSEMTHANMYQQSKRNCTHQLYLKKNIQFVITLFLTIHNKERGPIYKVVCYFVILL